MEVIFGHFDDLGEKGVLAGIVMFWGLFYQLRACNVSVAASGVIFYVGKSFLLAQKLCGEAWGGQYSCVKTILGVFLCFGHWILVWTAIRKCEYSEKKCCRSLLVMFEDSRTLVLFDMFHTFLRR